MLEPLAEPDLVQAIAHYVETYGAELHVSALARVERFDPVRQTVDVQPLVQHEYPTESGDRALDTLAVMQAIPVAYQRAGGGLEFPLAPGDVVLVVHTTRSIRALLRAIGPLVPVDPQVDCHHTINDAVAIPCVRRFSDAIADFTGDAVVLRAGGADDEVRIGSPAASEDANRVVVQSALDDFMTALNRAKATDTSGALALLQTQLQALNTSTGWKAGTSKAKAE